MRMANDQAEMIKRGLVFHVTRILTLAKCAESSVADSIGRTIRRSPDFDDIEMNVVKVRMEYPHVQMEGVAREVPWEGYGRLHVRVGATGERGAPGNAWREGEDVVSSRADGGGLSGSGILRDCGGILHVHFVVCLVFGGVLGPNAGAAMIAKAFLPSYPVNPLHSYYGPLSPDSTCYSV
eukprot:sb/3471689/